MRKRTLDVGAPLQQRQRRDHRHGGNHQIKDSHDVDQRPTRADSRSPTRCPYRTEKDGKCAVGWTSSEHSKEASFGGGGERHARKRQQVGDKLESAITRINAVITDASDATCTRAMKSDAMNVDAKASRHGMTLMIDKFIVT